jgi:DNA-directed RNA polymerase subunit RPC12/RpoP
MICAKCGATMDLAEKDTSSGRDIREYKCSECGHSDWEDRGPALWQILHDDAQERLAAAPPPPPVLVQATAQPQSKPNAFAHRAAKGSWIICVIVLLLNSFGRRIVGLGVVLDLFAFLGLVAGLVLGVVALFGIRNYGAKGILANALVGIVINGLFLLIFWANFLAAVRHG